MLRWSRHPGETRRAGGCAAGPDLRPWAQTWLFRVHGQGCRALERTGIGGRQWEGSQEDMGPELHITLARKGLDDPLVIATHVLGFLNRNSPVSLKNEFSELFL